MFRVYGFGAKTSSGFGLAEERVSGDLTVHNISSSTRSFDNFGQLTEVVHDLVIEDKVEHES